MCLFEEKMNAPSFVNVLHITLKPFITAIYPNGHWFMQDNDSKHTSRLYRSFMEENSINWWKTPAESPH